jgi:hypothetical protein
MYFRDWSVEKMEIRAMSFKEIGFMISVEKGVYFTAFPQHTSSEGVWCTPYGAAPIFPTLYTAGVNVMDQLWQQG